MFIDDWSGSLGIGITDDNCVNPRIPGQGGCEMPTQSNDGAFQGSFGHQGLPGSITECVIS